MTTFLASDYSWISQTIHFIWITLCLRGTKYNFRKIVRALIYASKGYINKPHHRRNPLFCDLMYVKHWR